MITNKPDVLYKKQGKKYVPVEANCEFYNFFKEGFYLIQVTKNCTSITNRVFPDTIQLQTAFREKVEHLEEILKEHLKMHPTKKLITKKQKKAWDAFSKVMGVDSYACQYDSIASLFHKFEKAICE